MLRHVLAATAASVAMAASAYAETNGSIELARTNHDRDLDLEVTGLNGTIFHGFGNGFGVQGEFQHHNLEAGGSDEQINRYTMHGLYRTEAWAAGALVGKADWFGFDLDHWGAEGALYFDRWTVQASYIGGEIDTPNNPEIGRFNVSGRYFFTDNFSVGAGLGKTSFETSNDIDWTSYDVNAEYRFGSFPVAIFAGFNSADFDGSGDDVDSVRFGLRWDIGTGSLIERDRQGASFSDAEELVQDLYRLD